MGYYPKEKWLQETILFFDDDGNDLIDFEEFSAMTLFFVGGAVSKIVPIRHTLFVTHNLHLKKSPPPIKPASMHKYLHQQRIQNGLSKTDFSAVLSKI